MGARQLHTVSPSPRQTLRQSPLQTSDSRAGQRVCPDSLKSTLPSVDPEATWASLIPSSRFTNTALAVNNNSWERWGYILSVRMHTKSGVLYINTNTDMVEWELTRICVILLEIKPMIQGSLTAWCSIICSSRIHPSDWLAMQSSTLTLTGICSTHTAAILQSLQWDSWGVLQAWSMPTSRRFQDTFSQCCP